MENNSPEDAVDRILQQWRRERPDLSIEAMGLLGRLARLRNHLSREIEAVLDEHGLSVSSFDVLATLRRSGPPYRLSPSELFTTMMVSSGTMTNRIDQLEKQGLVERQPNPDDGRSFLVALTGLGLQRVDRAVTAHVANQNRLVSVLMPDQQRELDSLLRLFLAAHE